jgi:hypothetical protein
LNCPTLILIGDNDSGRSNHLAQAEALKNRIPAQREGLARTIARLFWQAPEETNETILSFVKRHSAH